MVVAGVVRNLTSFGAFVEMEEGLDGLIHVSDLGWGRRGDHPSDFLHKGDAVTCLVLSVDPQRHRIALGLKQLTEDPWRNDVAGGYRPGEVVKGRVTKATNFGVFVELEPGLEGLLHVSELAPTAEGLTSGDEVEVEILRVDADQRKIGLSRKRL